MATCLQTIKERKGKKGPLFGLIALSGQDPRIPGGSFQYRPDSVLDSDLDSPTLRLPGFSLTAHFLSSKWEREDACDISASWARDAHSWRAVVWMWNLDSWEYWIGGVEWRGEEAHHMASFSEVKWRFKPVRCSLSVVITCDMKWHHDTPLRPLTRKLRHLIGVGAALRDSLTRCNHLQWLSS